MTRCARVKSLVKTPAASPNSVALARSMTSCSSSNSSTAMTGPKISSRTIVISSWQASNTAAANDELGPFSLAARDVGQHALHVSSTDERTNLGARIQGITDDERGGAGLETLHKGVFDAPMYKHTRAVRAHLTRRVEITEQSPRDRIFKLCVIKDDERRLAAELERDIFD